MHTVHRSRWRAFPWECLKWCAYRPRLAFCWLLSAWTLGKFAALTLLELRSLPKLFDPAHLYSAPAWELLKDGPSTFTHTPIAHSALFLR